ncbi:MAG: cellulase family glycosylhydrolase, partial [Thermoguttaceae bacterium]|nr:cellulase family glycosylhydrolase [Thermoguttaceae bacterium]
RYLELSDGTPYIPNGLNMISPQGPRTTEEGLAQMDRWMRALADNGGNYIRIWLSSPFWDPEHERAGVYDEQQAKRVDALLELARRHGIRVKMTIEHFREIDPENVRQSWAVKSLHHVSRGGTAKDMPDWLASEASRAQFRQKLAWLRDRFGEQGAIYAWELWNEVNAVRGGDYLGWSEAMLPELARLFPRNMTLQSLGSFDSDRARDPYRRLCQMQNNDVAQVHRYLDPGASLSVCHGPVDVLAADAVRELLAMNPGRPVILAEGGAVEPRHTGPFKLYAKDTAGIILHDVLFAPFFAGAAGAGQCWHWGEYVGRNNLWHQFRAFADTVQGIDPAAEGFEPLMIDHPRLRVYLLKGKRTSLAWCRDTENTWQAELEAGRAPDELRDVVLPLDDVVSSAGSKIRVYNPWTKIWSDTSTEGGAVRLPPFSRSLVVRVETR